MNLTLSLATGILLVLLFPRFGFTWLAPLALTPILIACARQSRWKLRFLHGWASGFVFWFFTCYWIQFVLEYHGGMGRWGGWATFVLFAVLKGLHTGLFAALAGRLIQRPWALLSVAALWTGIEYAHGSLGLAWIGLGFAWLDLGNAGIGFPLVMRLAPVTGVYGISFVFAMLGCAAALAILHRMPRGQSATRGRLARQFLPLGALPLLLLFPAPPAAEAGTRVARVVQPNINPEEQWTTQSFAGLKQQLADLSLPSAAEQATAPEDRASLLVWPEAPAPFYPDRPAFQEYVAGVAAAARVDFLFTGIAFNAEGSPLNSAFLFDAKGQPRDRYDKIQLVPFGEYIPPAFNWVNRITGEAGDFEPGSQVKILNVDGHRLGAFICYESAFPDLVRKFTAGGAEFLVNLSNDGYFGDSAARQQHLDLVRMRAAENRRWILRATNDGITAMIDPAGRITQTVPSYQRTAALLGFRYTSGLTFYARFGDWFAWTCILLAAATLLGTARKQPENFAGSARP